ncbi:MAG: acetylornithine deacetylase [Saprospiraceae bacterium]|nr:acetylornithine deacetylase [Saprospiraceae bacterium]
MDVKEILAQLVSFSVLGGQSNASIAEWIEKYLEKHGVVYQTVPHATENKRSIHCRIGPPVDGGLILSGHTDVVPVEGQPWKTDPFVLTDGGNGKLYGRGSCDMKGFIACCLAALPTMQSSALQKPLYFAFSYDEEVGCRAAPALAADIKSHYEESPKYALIGEPSMMQPIVGQKGIVIYKTSLNGSAGHSSRIRQEVSAISEAARLILWLEEKMDDLIQSGHIDKRFDPPHTSIHSGVFEHSGIAPNVVSDHASFYWDVRVIPQDKGKSIREDFDAYCRALEEKNRTKWDQFEIKTVEAHPDVPALDTSEETEIVELTKIFSGRSDLGTVSYAAEAGQFAEAGFQSIICGPGDIMQAHRADEFIEIDQLEKGMEMMNRIVKWASS